MTEEASEWPNLIKCTVISCPNYFHKELLEGCGVQNFHPFPEDSDVAQIWKEKCGVAAEHPIIHAKVCSNHFKPGDFFDDERTSLKPEAVPRDNLGWMLGMPEVKLGVLSKFELIKEAVDSNQVLLDRFEKLVKDVKPVQEKVTLYKKKVDNVDKEIYRLRGLIDKFPVKKRNGKVVTNLICKVFSQAQINMLLGKKKVVWSYDDMAMAFTLRHIGNKECYLYLKDTLNLPLPSLSAVQRWVASNK